MRPGVILLGVSVALGCSAADPAAPKPAKGSTDHDGTTTVEVGTDETPGDVEDAPLGSGYEARRRRAFAGCVQTASSALTGTVYAETTYDAWGWPVEKSTYAGDTVRTSYERDSERVLSSRSTFPVASTDTGCATQLRTMSTEYDVAERPVRVVTTTEGCGTVVETGTTHAYVLDDGVLIERWTSVDGVVSMYTTYDSCAMLKLEGDAKYHNHYLDDCVIDFVERRRYGWEWFYEDERPVRYTVEGSENDTVYTYRDCR